MAAFVLLPVGFGFTRGEGTGRGGGENGSGKWRGTVAVADGSGDVSRARALVALLPILTAQSLESGRVGDDHSLPAGGGRGPFTCKSSVCVCIIDVFAVAIRSLTTTIHELRTPLLGDSGDMLGSSFSISAG